MVMSVASAASNFAHQIPGWLGTLAIDFDGKIVYSAGDLSDDTELAPKFLELARRLAEYMTLEGPSASQENPFKRLTNSNSVAMVIFWDKICRILGECVACSSRRHQPEMV